MLKFTKRNFNIRSNEFAQIKIENQIIQQNLRIYRKL